MVETVDPDYLPRHLDATLAAALKDAPVVILDGPRAAGKTTTARRQAASEVMLPRDLPLLAADAERFLAALEPPVLIDEWQLAGVDLLWSVKRIVDEEPSPGRFLLTGSVEPATYGPTYPLTGRAVRLLMRPMTRAELSGCGAQPTFLQRMVEGEPLQPSMDRHPTFSVDWLSQSGFPGSRAMADPSLLLGAYAATVAQRAGDEGRDATRLLRAMKVLAVLEAQAVPDQRIWQSAGINKATWQAYDDLLQRVHLAVPLPAFETNRLKRLTSYPKRFTADTALALTLAEVDVPQLAADPRLTGRYLESFVMQQLRPQADILHGRLAHVRTSAGEREIDAVFEKGNDVLGFEVKHASRPTPDDARQLVWLHDEMPERFHSGYVVHTGADVFPLAERIWAVPVSLLA